MYESPIKIFEQMADICTQIIKKKDEDIYQAIISYGITVDKEELLRALKYDRNQYEKGYMDGKADAMAELVRCKDCRHWVVNDDVGYCDNPDGLDNYARPEDFCSYGERKDNG